MTSYASSERPSNKALRLSWHSACPSKLESPLASTVGASPTVCGLRHAAERPVRHLNLK